MVAPRDGDVLESMLEMATLAGAGDSLVIYAMPSPPLMHDRDAVHERSSAVLSSESRWYTHRRPTPELLHREP